jgi:hypothetical protein
MCTSIQSENIPYEGFAFAYTIQQLFDLLFIYLGESPSPQSELPGRRLLQGRFPSYQRIQYRSSRFASARSYSILPLVRAISNPYSCSRISARNTSESVTDWHVNSVWHKDFLSWPFNNSYLPPGIATQFIPTTLVSIMNRKVYAILLS